MKEEVFNNITGWYEEVRFKWKVYNKYEVLNYEELKDKFNFEIQVPKDYHYIYAPDNEYFNKSYKVYNPVEENIDIFLKFSQINTDNKDYILDWISKYGLPGKLGDRKNHLFNEDAKRLVEKGIIYPYEQFVSKINKANFLLKLYLLTVVNSDYKEIKKHTTCEKLENEMYSFNFKNLAGEIYLLEDKPNNSDYGYLALNVINNKISKELKGIVPIIGDISHVAYEGDEKDEWNISSSWQCNNLMSALYLHFYWLVTQNERIKKCEYKDCGNYFSANRTDQKFCSTSCRKKHHYHQNK